MRSRTDFLVFVIGHPPAGKRLIAGTGGFFIALLSRRKSAGIKKDHFAVAFFMFVSWKGPSYCLDASKDALRNSFIAFSISSELLRARVPAALFPFSNWALASFSNSAYNAATFSISSFIILFVLLRL